MVHTGRWLIIRDYPKYPRSASLGTRAYLGYFSRWPRWSKPALNLFLPHQSIGSYPFPFAVRHVKVFSFTTIQNSQLNIISFSGWPLWQVCTYSISFSTNKLVIPISQTCENIIHNIYNQNTKPYLTGILGNGCIIAEGASTPAALAFFLFGRTARIICII